MEDNKLLMIVLAFILGCMASGMMKSMCGGRLVEGSTYDTYGAQNVYSCIVSNITEKSEQEDTFNCLSKRAAGDY